VAEVLAYWNYTIADLGLRIEDCGLRIVEGWSDPIADCGLRIVEGWKIGKMDWDIDILI